MEAFSDGVFAIAATLLVLELSLEPAHNPAGAAAPRAWPGYLGYVVSFLTIGSAWLGHSVLTDRLTSADSILLRINLALLLVVAFLPFPTKLVAEGLHDPGACASHHALRADLLAIRFLELAMSVHARRAGLHPPASDREGEVLEESEVLPAIAAYVVAIVIGLFFPAVAVALYFGIAVFLVLPFREISRLLFRRP